MHPQCTYMHRHACTLCVRANMHTHSHPLGTGPGETEGANQVSVPQRGLRALAHILRLAFHVQSTFSGCAGGPMPWLVHRQVSACRVYVGAPSPAQVHGGTGARKDLYVYPGDCGDNAPHHMTLPCQGTCTHRVAVLIWASSGNEVDGARALQPHRPSSAICLAG